MKTRDPWISARGWIITQSQNHFPKTEFTPVLLWNSPSWLWGKIDWSKYRCSNAFCDLSPLNIRGASFLLLVQLGVRVQVLPNQASALGAALSFYLQLLFDVAVPAWWQPSEGQSHNEAPDRHSNLNCWQECTRDPQCQGGVIDSCGIKRALGTDRWPSIDGHICEIASQQQTFPIVGHSDTYGQEEPNAACCWEQGIQEGCNEKSYLES